MVALLVCPPETQAEALKTTGEVGRREPPLVQTTARRESGQWPQARVGVGRRLGHADWVFCSASPLTTIPLRTPPGKPGANLAALSPAGTACPLPGLSNPF